MPRDISITRQEAESLVDILESLTDDQLVRWIGQETPEELAADIRKLFGMVPRGGER